MSKTELCDMPCPDAADPEERPRNEPRGAAAAFESYLQPCLAELLGSALFIFVGCCSVVQNSATTGLLQPALAHGLALVVVIAVLGEIRYRLSIILTFPVLINSPFCLFFFFFQIFLEKVKR